MPPPSETVVHRLQESLDTGELVSDDRLLGGRVKFYQPRRGYRAAIDPVFLAAAVSPANGLGVLDIGCGAGAAGLCLAARCPKAHVTGLDNDAAITQLAAANIHRNGWSDRMSVVAASIAAPSFPAGVFDQAMINPPYWPGRSHTASPHPGRAAAAVEKDTPLTVWVTAAFSLLKDDGVLTLILPADRADDVLSDLRGKIGPITVQPLAPRRGVAPKRAIIQTRKAGTSSIRRLAPLVLHTDGSAYSSPAQGVLRRGDPLPMS